MTDLISRADAIELCAEAQGRASTKSELKGISKIWQVLLKLPSAEAVQGVGRYENAMQKLREMPKYLNGVKAKQIKKIPSEAVQGEWLEREDWNGDYYYDCSVCGESFVLCDGTPSMNLYHFCPNCGAKMVKGGDTK